LIEGFTKDYGVHRLMWFGNGGSMEEAIRRGKQIKKWSRQGTIDLIERDHPEWRDLALDPVFEPLERRGVDWAP